MKHQLRIAANGLPLHDALVPFLVARSGRALHDFIRWVVPRRMSDWVYDMLEYLPMSAPIRREVLERLARSNDPVVAARQREILEFMLNARPDWKEQIIEEDVQKRIHLGRLTEARDALREVLASRGIALRPADEERVEGCEDLPTLKRWLRQAANASTVEEALR